MKILPNVGDLLKRTKKKGMQSSESVIDEESVALVRNISEINGTFNGTKPKVLSKFLKNLFIISVRLIILGPNDDKSINNIIFGIGLVVVSLFLLLIIIKLIYKCYRIYRDDDDNKTEQGMSNKKQL